MPRNHEGFSRHHPEKSLRSFSGRKKDDTKRIDFDHHVELGKELRKLAEKTRKFFDISMNEKARNLFSRKKKDFAKGKKHIPIMVKGKKEQFPRSADNAFYLEHIAPALSGGMDQFFLLNEGVALLSKLKQLAYDYKEYAKGEDQDLGILKEIATELRGFRKTFAEFLQKWATDGFLLKISTEAGDFKYKQSESRLDGEELLKEFDQITAQMVK